jgi:hypothetical protein
MRVYSLVICMVLGMSTAALAQQPAFGIKGGLNFANLHFDGDDIGDETLDRRTGGVGGVFMLWPATGKLALQAEGLFSQKGAKVDEEGIEGTIKIDYLDVPVLLRLSSGSSSGTSFHVFGGPSVGFRLKARAKGTADGESSDDDISEDIERMDVGVVAGVGVEMGRVSIDGRQSWGLSNINKDPDDPTKIKNRVFSVMVGYRF